MQDKKRIGVVGMGIRGKMYANFIATKPNIELVAISESNTKNLKASKEEFNVSGYTDYKEMIDKSKLDCIIIATPDFLHRDIVIYSAENKLDMLVEKPFSTSVKEAEEMSSAIKENNVVCMVAFENRWSLPFINTKNSILNGDLGDILNINAKLNDDIFVPTKMINWAGDTTPAWFLFPHIIDMASYLTNKKVKKVYAAGTKKKLASMSYDTYDTIQSIVTFSDDTTSTFMSSWVLPSSMPALADQKFEIIGDKASLYVNLFEQMTTFLGDKYSYPRILGTPINGRISGPTYYMFEHFIDSIVNNTTPLATEDDGVENTKIIYAIHESLKTGQPVNL